MWAALPNAPSTSPPLERPAEGLIRPELRVGEGSAGLETALRVGDRREWLVLDLDQLGRVASQVRALGDDRRDGHAGRIHYGAGEVRTQRLLQPGDRRHEREPPQRPTATALTERTDPRP